MVFWHKLLITTEKFQNANQKMSNKGFQTHGDRIYHHPFGLDRRLGKICNEKGLFLEQKDIYFEIHCISQKSFQYLTIFFRSICNFWEY